MTQSNHDIKNQAVMVCSDFSPMNSLVISQGSVVTGMKLAFLRAIQRVAFSEKGCQKPSVKHKGLVLKGASQLIA